MESLKSVKGILRSEILSVKADFAAMSAFSLPLIPTWLESQQKTMLLSSANSLCFKRTSKRRGFSIWRLCSDWRTERESEKMIKSEFLDCSIWSKAKSIALISAEKIEALSGNRHLYISDGVAFKRAILVSKPLIYSLQKENEPKSLKIRAIKELNLEFA